MNRVSVSCLGVCIALASGSAIAALDRTGDFALLDDSGVFHQLSRYQHRKAVVLMSYAESCQSMSAMLDEFTALKSRYAGDDIEFLLLDSQGQIVKACKLSRLAFRFSKTMGNWSLNPLASVASVMSACSIPIVSLCTMPVQPHKSWALPWPPY